MMKSSKMQFSWSKTASGSWQMSKVAQAQAAVDAAQQMTIPAARALAQAVAAKLSGSTGDKIALKNLICKIFPKQVPEACAWIPDAEKVKSQLLAALPSTTGNQYAAAATALGVDPTPFQMASDKPLPPSAVQAMRGAFTNAKSAEGIRDMCKIAARINSASGAANGRN